MPFYEYQCKNCGHDLEAMQKVNDPPLKKCPECGKSRLTRLMSAPVFRLKGAGWYETDFKGDQDNKKNLADRPEAEATKDEAKPAADAKTVEATGKDASGKETAGKDAGGKESKDAAKVADKATDKPVKAVPTESSKKPVGGAMSKRGASAPARPAPKKVTPKKAIRKPAPKARRRG
jgi:putative FmdB family regulatory protein